MFNDEIETNLILDPEKGCLNLTKEEAEKNIKDFVEYIAHDDGTIEKHLYFNEKYFLCKKEEAKYERIEIYKDGNLENKSSRKL